VDFLSEDFNGADRYYAGQGAGEWAEIEAVVRELPIYFQASQQAGISGRAIFDPKSTNAFLTDAARNRGWHAIPVPTDLTEFGLDWDAGKGATLAEWQFSNYPFLWNNVIRSEAVYKSRTVLKGLRPVEALIVVTKSGLFPSSNSTLYFGQTKAQLQAVTKFATFSIPIRLVGLTIPDETTDVEVVWSEYSGRYAREVLEQTTKRMAVRWGAAGKFGTRSGIFTDV
jgi:hypothetical protein